MFASNPIPPRWAADFGYCREIVNSHEENFPVGSCLAPKPLRPFLYAIYAFARTADDFADLPGRDDATRLQLLDDWSRRLSRAELGEPDHPIFRALTHTMEVTGLPPTPLHDLLIAFRMDVTNKRYDTMEELEEYCRYSANPVGRIVLHMSEEVSLAPGAPVDRKVLYSDAICTALQLTNHWQDLGQDVWAGRPLYLPREEMARFEVTEEMVLKRRFTPMLGSLMLHLTARTRDLFRLGEPLLDEVEWPLKLELAAIVEGGLAVLDQIESFGGNTLRVRPRLSTWDRAGCLWRAFARTAP